MARACLDMMTAMVTQGPEAARDVCSSLDLNKKALFALVTKRDSKVRAPVSWLSVVPFPLGDFGGGFSPSLPLVLTQLQKATSLSRAAAFPSPPHPKSGFDGPVAQQNLNHWDI